MSKRRVVITSMGVVSPIGNTLDEVYNSLITSNCGIDFIKNIDTSDLSVKLAGEIKDLDFKDYVDKKSLKRMDRVNILGLIAAKKAFEDNNIDLDSVDTSKIGVFVSSGIGGLNTIEEQHSRGLDLGFEKLSPFFIPMAIVNLTASHIASLYGFHGSCNCPVTACAGATTAIGEAFRNIRDGYLDMIFAGGSEASITKLGIGGFASMKALSDSQDKNRASIPFDLERNGFVMGEGAGILVLEELEHAKNRGAKIYGEVIGYGETCDAGHITAPNEEGLYSSKAMENAIVDGGISIDRVDYINAHGTSTPLNDLCETRAVKRLFKDHVKDLYISSTKSMTGHLLGASGAVESIITILSLKNSIIPPTINYKQADPECDLNIVPNEYIQKDITYALSNSFGFGGHNASLLLKKWED